MTKFLYNKIIRDKLIDRMLAEDMIVNIKNLNEEEYQRALKDKLLEEVQEVCNAASKIEITEELADIIEVIYALSHAYQITPEEVEAVRLEKFQQKGNFEDHRLVRYIEYDENDEKFKEYTEYYHKQPEKYPKIDP